MLLPLVLALHRCSPPPATPALLLLNPNCFSAVTFPEQASQACRTLQRGWRAWRRRCRCACGWAAKRRRRVGGLCCCACAFPAPACSVGPLRQFSVAMQAIFKKFLAVVRPILAPYMLQCLPRVGAPDMYASPGISLLSARTSITCSSKRILKPSSSRRTLEPCHPWPYGLGPSPAGPRDSRGRSGGDPSRCCINPRGDTARGRPVGLGWRVGGAAS